MLHPTKQKLSKLYISGKSMKDIADSLHCSIHTVVYWMDKYGIKRRTLSEATYIKANPHGDPFHIQPNLTRQEQFLYGLGVGIYLGEGNKMAPHALRIANTNPLVHKLFLQFLSEVCHFDKHRISYSIVCFNDTDPKKARAYWAKQLQISPEKFGKITQIPKQGKGTYKKKSLYGVCTTQANNTKLAAWLRGNIIELEKNHSPG